MLHAVLEFEEEPRNLENKLIKAGFKKKFSVGGRTHFINKSDFGTILLIYDTLPNGMYLQFRTAEAVGNLIDNTICMAKELSKSYSAKLITN